MALAQKPDFVFWRNGRVHLNQPGGKGSVQSTAGSRGVRMSGNNAGYAHVPRKCEEYWLPTPFASFHFTFPPVRHRVPSHFNRSLTTKSTHTKNLKLIQTDDRACCVSKHWNSQARNKSSWCPQSKSCTDCTSFFLNLAVHDDFSELPEIINHDGTDNLTLQGCA